MKRFLIIQTAFIGDVILATVLIEKLHALYPGCKIDFLLRKGNEELLIDHPKLSRVIVWGKRKNKYLNLLKVVFKVRRKPYHMIVNAHRFSSSGFITFLTRAREKRGFDKNPFAFCYTKKVTHQIGNGKHEVERNLELLEDLGGGNDYKPKLYFSENDQRRVDDLVQGPYVTMAPSSVWQTKQLPKEKWSQLIGKIPVGIKVCLIGSANDVTFCEDIINMSERENVLNLSGKLRMLESTALMSGSLMNYCNDSAPLHISSAVNAPSTAFFCSTIPEFGFGPLSDQSVICQTKEELSCKPCGLHGKAECPEKHFKCGFDIELPEFTS